MLLHPVVVSDGIGHGGGVAFARAVSAAGVHQGCGRGIGECLVKGWVVKRGRGVDRVLLQSLELQQ